MSKVDAALIRSGIEAYENQDYAEAFRLLIPLAQAGNPQAQCYVASMYQGGLGVPVDGPMAVEWYRKAAIQEERIEHISAVAFNNLATIYSVGMPGIPPDKELAEQCWRKASELGFKMIPKGMGDKE
jgi:TPR repeat protein